MFKVSEVTQINVPNYAELNVKTFWKYIQSKEYLKKCFPDYKDSQTPERKYLFNLLYSIDSKFVLDKITTAQKNRVIDSKIEQNQIIEIRKDMLDQIQSSNYFSSTSYAINLL